jgi:hypothetical protein
MLVAGGKKFWVVVVMFDLDILHPSEMESIAIDGVMEVTVATLPKGLGEYVKGVQGMPNSSLSNCLISIRGLVHRHTSESNIAEKTFKTRQPTNPLLLFQGVPNNGMHV